ncbi:hypothetical protein D9757_002915 [Collybiopsis confluens]|uniref:Uncharacterized protein n=1 Tax=Collybiopsis confluens TaxID=2823264 RepID=A0A8H5HVW5_9AGAR|nr:hypothetical protein D9757_002915 [Collybiopsis confluens]
MLSVARVFLAFQAAVSFASISSNPSAGFALATPFYHTAATTTNNTSFEEAGPRPKTPMSTPNSSPNTLHSRSRPALFARVEPRPNQFDSVLETLSLHANTLETCSGSCLNAPDDQQQQSTSTVASFCAGLLDFQGNLQKGEAFYDKNNGLETIIRDLINTIKDTLKYIKQLVDCTYLLGVPLGPLVGEIKCFIDWLLDFCENATDASLNDLVPLLQELLALCGTCSDNVCLLSGLL